MKTKGESSSDERDESTSAQPGKIGLPEYYKNDNHINWSNLHTKIDKYCIQSTGGYMRGGENFSLQKKFF